MITKRRLIELVQNRLAGGDAPSDIQGKYPKPVISQLLSLVYSDIATRKRSLVRNMAIGYDCTIMTANGDYYVVLPVKPINGMNGVVWVSKGQKFFPNNQGLEQTNIMAFLLPQIECTLTNIIQNKLYFSSNPNETSVRVEILPDFQGLGEDDNVCVEGMETEMYSMVMAKMRENTSQLEEVYNNRVPDTDKPTNPAK